MTEEPEGPVHYQISVTGRQAAAFFVALLAALGLAFFFGMRTGAAAKKGPDAVTRLAAASDIPVPTEPASEAPTPAPDLRPGRSEAPVPEPGERKLGFDDAPPQRPAPTPAATEKPAVEPERPTPAAAPKKPATAAAPKAAATADKDEGPFFVQVAALSAEKADELEAKLKKAGFRTDLALAPGKPGVFRVRVGPYADRPKAEVAVKRLQAEKWTRSPAIVKP